jgi:indole-3-glycerol phosphate synthase/phosphoribosylanthranilate isomerase/anthranilate synthase/indole-3-glycerol phosphate synthase/phosphoribosylanthranilate isomerase
METALKSGARIVGVNSRDLKTLTIDLNVARKLAPMARGSDVVLIAESGIQKRADIDELMGFGYRGLLVGSSLIETGHPGKALAELLGRKPK